MQKRTLTLIKEHDIKWISLRFTNTRGQEQHILIPASRVDKNLFDSGIAFDGSSIDGWKDIKDSDMILIPDDETAVVDPLAHEPSILLFCNVTDPETMERYALDPRNIAQKAEKYLISTNIADTAFFGPEPEFFILDSVQWKVDSSGAFYKLSSEEAAWTASEKLDDENLGHRPKLKGGYFAVPPIDRFHDIRTSMCSIMEKMNLIIEAHHHEVGTAGQCEIGVRFNSLTKKADEVQIFKYCVRNIAHKYGKTATFMPKPIVGDNGSGMHCHQSLFLNGNNLFSGGEYAGLSEMALHYIGGIIHHAKAINAFTNGTINSHKRLVPNFEAPIMLGYSKNNRSAAIRIPHTEEHQARRIEVRFPDASCNPYLSFAAMLMAGIDGIQNKIHPGNHLDKNFYQLSTTEQNGIPKIASSLQQSLDALDTDRKFLLAGGVFSNEAIDSYINLKTKESQYIQSMIHPVEFDLYYSV